MRRQDETEDRWVAIPPDIASHDLTRPLERAILTQQHTVAGIFDALSAAEDVYRTQQRTSAAPVRLLHGADVIYAALERASEACREELLTAHPGGTRDPEALGKTLPRTLRLNERGVRQRTLYQHAVRAHGPTLAYIEQVTSAGAQVRTLDEIIDRVIVYDRSIAFIPDPRYDQRTTALAVEHPALIHYLVKVFDHAWQRAEPVTVGQDHRPPLLTDETRRAVLKLMVEGHTDAGIGSRLGISSRTVSHHIKKASESIGSRSRAHLAYLLARSELLHPDRDG
ncbi:helix-turn-helix transcriptional regulator [Streptomyces sp. SID5785]|uniref:helix-turn-helix domain-containing protein n=1 Tax=Streptomyces sp. SID5785 TaxID=2690309 RepID=UPI001F1D779F|nr:helix-turn-helix transcriptional regulator [Streptomyces sp. SID5785]